MGIPPYQGWRNGAGLEWAGPAAPAPVPTAAVTPAKTPVREEERPRQWAVQVADDGEDEQSAPCREGQHPRRCRCCVLQDGGCEIGPFCLKRSAVLQIFF